MIAYSRRVTGTDCATGAATSIAPNYASDARPDSEEEVRPGLPPVVAAGDDRFQFPTRCGIHGSRLIRQLTLVENAEQMNGAEVVTGQVVAADVKGLRQISDDVKNRLSGPSAVVLAAALGDKAVLVANLHPDVSRRVGAGEIAKEVSGILGGGGGVGPTMAQAGGGEVAAIPEALLKAKDVLGQRLADPDFAKG